MKKIFLFLAIAMSFINSCTKSSSSPGGNGGNNNGGNNNGGNGGNNTNVITITSISPERPYPDDQITINGTGFNVDASKDTLEFGRLINGNFGAWHEGLETEWPSLCTVVSATATKLVVRSASPFKLDYNAFVSGPASIAVIQVRTGGKKAVTSVIPFKRLFQCSGLTNLNLFNDAIGRPNDSLIISGKGFAKNGLSASIDGKELTNFKVDSAPESGTISLRLPKTFFGEVNDETISVEKPVTLTQPDGKTSQKTFHFLLSPQMQVSSMYAENNIYSLDGLNSSGGVVKIYVSGKALKSDAVVKLDGITIHTQAGLGVTGFPDNTVISLSAGSLAVGNLQVSIWRGETLYGAANFKVTQ